ncbi:hypothetical protein D6783_03020 [Candidatus Woesearchaeota archaeon]|nr:MAG: hypothetical protein D6783_03020 [Candidatus Woesearchaeota archaeon]
MLFFSERFKRWQDRHRHDMSELDRVERELKHIQDNPHTGKPLGIPCLHEKKFGNKRILYLYYDDLHAVFVIDVVDKKHQKQEISLIREHVHLFRDHIQKAFHKNTQAKHVNNTGP